MSNEFLIPKNLRLQEGKHLFSLVGFNRTRRRDYCKRRRISEEALALELLDPKVRVWRFWCVWWRDRHGAEGPKGLPSVDLAALLEFMPQLRNQDFDEALLRASLVDFSINPAGIQALIEEEDRSKFEFSLKPFAVWPAVVERLASWPNLTESEQTKLANVAFALDGISASRAFTTAAVRLAPACAECFEPVEMAAEWDVEVERTQSTSDVHFASLSSDQILEQWQTRWREIGEVASLATRQPIGRAAIDRADDMLATLKALENLATRVDQRTSATLTTLDDCIRRAGAAFEAAGFPPLNEDIASGLGESVGSALNALAPGMQEELVARTENLVASIGDGAVKIEGAMQVKREAAERLADVDRQIGTIQTWNGRVALLRTRNELTTSGTEAEIQLAEAAHDVEARLRAFRLELDGVLPESRRTPTADDASKEPVPRTTAADAGRSPALPMAGAVSGNTGKSDEEKAKASGITVGATEIVASGTEAPGDNGAAELHGEIAPERVTETAFPTGAASPVSPNESDGRATAPPSDHSQPFNEFAGNQCQPIWNALRQHNAALAYQIGTVFASLRPGVLVPPTSLLKAVALAGSVRYPHGEVARELAKCYESLDSQAFEAGPQEWKSALSILLIAATLKPGLVAPATGATAVMRYAHPTQAIHELRELVIGTGDRLQTLNLGPDAFRQVGTVAELEREWKTFQEELVEWKHRAPQFGFQFGRAGAVWRYLISSQGRLGQLVELLLVNDRRRVAEITRILDAISLNDQLRREINRIDRHELGQKRGQDIHAGALKQLQDKSGEALDLARRWMDLVGRGPSDDNFALRTLEGFRHGYRNLRPAVERELMELSSSGSSWMLVPSSVVTLRSALASLDELLVAAQQPAEQPANPARILGLPLLQAAGLDLNEDWRPLNSTQEVLDALQQVVEAPVDWRDAFKARLDRGDIRACDEILKVLEESSDVSVETMPRERDQAAQVWRGRLATNLSEARNYLESALAVGYLREQERGNLDAQLATLENQLDSISHFQSAVAKVEIVVARLDEFKMQRLDEVAGELTALNLAAGSEAERRLRAVIASGDVFTAHEYLQRVRAGEPLPDVTNQGGDAFQDFFPDRANTIETLLADGKAGFADIKNSLAAGRTMGCLDFSSVGPEQRASAALMLDAWYALKRARAPEGKTANIQAVLDGLGFAGTKIAVREQTRDKVECVLNGQAINERNICPVASFGSQAKGSYHVVVVWSQPTDEDLPRIVGDSAAGKPTIVLYLGTMRERQRRELARVTRLTGASFVVLDEILMLHLCAEPRSRLGAFFACALPFSCVKPFVTTSGLVPPEMFFGRTDELKAVMDRNGRCFVYGGRQLGKTALLRAAERLFHQPARRQYAIWLDLKAAGIGVVHGVDAIWSALHQRLLELIPSFGDIPEPLSGRKNGAERFLSDLRVRFAPDRNARLLLLLDEADRFLEQDGRGHYHETGLLKGLMDSTDRGVKVVFAGLHNVLRTTEQANHPLAHFGDPIEIGPFTGASEWNEARNMIRGPLLAAGYRLASDDLIVRILAQTNYYPVLIQLYGEQLIRILHDPNRQRFQVADGPRYTITGAVVDEAYRERSLREAITQRFRFTLQLDPRYEVITYALAWAFSVQGGSFAAGIGVSELRESAMYWWAGGFRGVGDREFRIILDEMVGLGVLRRASERAYSLRNPNLLRLLGPQDQIEAELTKTREPPIEFEPGAFRAPDPDEESGPRRSPLTFAQVNLLSADNNGVSLVTGVRAAGFDDLRHFMTKQVPGLQWRSDITSLGEFRRSLDARREKGSTVLVLPSDVPWGDAWIKEALDKVGRLKATDKRLRVVFVADPDMLWRVIGVAAELEELGLECLPLRPWSEGFLRQWLEDIRMAGDAHPVRQSLAAATGLWPGVFMPVPLRCHQLADLLAHVQQQLAVPAVREQLLTDFAIPAGDARNALRLLQALPDEPLEDLMAFAPEMHLAPERVLDRLMWAERLQIAQCLGKNRWQLDPFVELLIRSHSHA